VDPLRIFNSFKNKITFLIPGVGRLKIQSGDEIQELANEFNEMALKLQASHSSLEQEAAERTQGVAVVNKIARTIGSKRNFADRNLEMLIPIAEQLAIAAETIRLFEQTKKLDQLKSDFVSKVSHELRTPLTSIKGFTEILLSYQDIDLKTRQEFLTIINEESERLTRLINDILDISKIEAGKTEWNIQPLSPSEIVVHAVKSVRAMAVEKNLPIVIDVPESLPKIRGDRDQLIQVLDNLLGNAIKFSNSGHVTIQGVQEDRMVRISVIDTGVGIPDADIQKIFDKFHHLGDTRTGKPRGTGLGLSICREIIQRLGGKIWCESHLGNGSRFHFTVPLWLETPRNHPMTFERPAAPGGRDPDNINRDCGLNI
jgi:signal transduction histidine kinase